MCNKSYTVTPKLETTHSVDYGFSLVYLDTNKPSIYYITGHRSWLGGFFTKTFSALFDFTGNPHEYLYDGTHWTLCLYEFFGGNSHSIQRFPILQHCLHNEEVDRPLFSRGTIR